MENNTNRFFNSRWGVFNHFLYNEPGSDMNFGPDLIEWNERVNNFDTEKLAETLHKMGAGYYFITIMQDRKYMIAPNAAFDKICGWWIDGTYSVFGYNDELLSPYYMLYVFTLFRKDGSVILIHCAVTAFFVRMILILTIPLFSQCMAYSY